MAMLCLSSSGTEGSVSAMILRGEVVAGGLLGGLTNE